MKLKLETLTGNHRRSSLSLRYLILNVTVTVSLLRKILNTCQN